MFRIWPQALQCTASGSCRCKPTGGAGEADLGGDRDDVERKQCMAEAVAVRRVGLVVVAQRPDEGVRPAGGLRLRLSLISHEVNWSGTLPVTSYGKSNQLAWMLGESNGPARSVAMSRMRP